MLSSSQIFLRLFQKTLSWNKDHQSRKKISRIFLIQIQVQHLQHPLLILILILIRLIRNTNTNINTSISINISTQNINIQNKNNVSKDTQKKTSKVL